MLVHSAEAPRKHCFLFDANVFVPTFSMPRSMACRHSFLNHRRYQCELLNSHQHTSFRDSSSPQPSTYYIQRAYYRKNTLFGIQGLRLGYTSTYDLLTLYRLDMYLGTGLEKKSKRRFLLYQPELHVVRACQTSSENDVGVKHCIWPSCINET